MGSLLASCLKALLLLLAVVGWWRITFSTGTRSPAHNRARAAFAALSAAWVFVLVCLGAFTTSINAGMIFPDWPLSNGSLNPQGWLTNLSMFAEHSHRLSAGLMTTLTLILQVWICRTDSRPWMRRLAIFAMALVLVQAVVGGLRVLLEPDEIRSINTSVGRLFAMLHACLAQIFACALIALAVASSARWRAQPVPVSEGVRRLGRLCCALLLLQLAIAAVMRHSFAGLAIPTFPWSTADHHLLPAVWSFKVGIHFAHRCMAAILAVALVTFAARMWRDRGATLGMRTSASLLISLLALQILLGASIVWTYRDPAITTGHVLIGAVTLATTFWLTWLAHRDAIES